MGLGTLKALCLFAINATIMASLGRFNRFYSKPGTVCLVDMAGPCSLVDSGHRHYEFPHNVASVKMELYSQW